MAYNTNQDILLDKVSNNTGEALNPGTVTYISGTKKFTGPFFAFTALTDTVIDVSECDLNIKESDGSGAMQALSNNITIPTGMTIYGNFHSIEIDSGTGIAYSKESVTVTVEA